MLAAASDPLCTERAEMVEHQLRRRGIADPRVLRAMGAVRREYFVPSELRASAYDDHALAIACGQTISQPYMVARACELASIAPGDRVLEIGAGSGYQAAVLATLAAEVVTIERIPELADGARKALRDLAIANVTVITGDGTLGYPSRAPYDAIVVAAGAPTPPPALLEQLAEQGRLVIPLGNGLLQTLTVMRKTPKGLETQSYDGCVYVPLRGAGGWTDLSPPPA